MAINYDWQIETIETAKSEDGMSDVAKSVHWRMNANDDTDDLSATAYGSVGLDAPEEDAREDHDHRTAAEG